ncbi:nucleotide pyrophosphohydrolase [Acidaminobacter sp. JC074]|uniref:nucleotide pyrophosphohydrolase n=1 Tax=Acidaminobacter sp. JC074 TaxID=2530199 RepID=UPI001F1072EC|nr:nucleotide pyrophosphohydrolase [Acidaminobacter sp. JC074]
MNKFNEINEMILKFRNERDWEKFHTPENLSKSIAIESGELLENFQWGDDYKKDEVVDELADILIYSLLLADSIGVDPYEIIEAKVKKNELRFPVNKVKGNSGKYTKVQIDD